MTNYFLGNQLLCFKIKSYNIFCIGMVTRLQQIFVHICANVAHKRRYSDTHIFKKKSWTIISIFCHKSSMCSHCQCPVLCLLLLSSLIFVWPMLSSLCFVCDLFCARSPVKGALCNAHRRAAIMREPLALLASTLPIFQLCSHSAKQGCNYFSLFQNLKQNSSLLAFSWDNFIWFYNY